MTITCSSVSDNLFKVIPLLYKCQNYNLKDVFRENSCGFIVFLPLFLRADEADGAAGFVGEFLLHLEFGQCLVDEFQL